MRTGLIGKKIGSSSYFEDGGTMVGVTLVRIDDCIVSAVKTLEKNGYNAIQIFITATYSKPINDYNIPKDCWILWDL